MDAKDRELLELAAKSSGIHLEWNGDFPVEVFERWSGDPDELPERDYQDWNPLTDDGAAMRLAVECQIAFGTYATYTSSAAIGTELEEVVVWFHEVSDAMTAARLAIVRAAAEIGRAKQ